MINLKLFKNICEKSNSIKKKIKFVAARFEFWLRHFTKGNAV